MGLQSTTGAATMSSSGRVCHGAEEEDDDNSSMASDTIDNSIVPPRLVVTENHHKERRGPSAKQVIPSTKSDYTGPLPLPPMDLEREKTKMESFDCYILVSVLTATASFSTLQAFEPLDDVRDSWINHSLLILTQISAGMSTICGLYATVVFSLTVLYAKSAIGMNRDHMYQYFLKQTAVVRVRGFRAFSASLLSFALEAGLVTFLRIPAIARLPVLVCVMALLHYICRDWQLIVETATVIYTGKIPLAPAPVPHQKKTG